MGNPSVFGVLLEQIHDQLDELNHCEEEGTKGQATKVVAESHLGATGNWGVQLAVGTVIVVPHAAGRGDGEDADSLDQGVGPQGSEDEEVKPEQAGLSVALDRCEDVAWEDYEIGRREQVYHTDEAGCPHPD